MAKRPRKWMQNLKLKEGALTRQAKAAGMSIAEFCKKSGLSPTTKKRCTLAKTFRKVARKRGK